MAKTKRTPVDFSELGGFRYLHFGSEWIQGGMRINRPYSLALEYQQYMLALLFFRPEPGKIHGHHQAHRTLPKQNEERDEAL